MRVKYVGNLNIADISYKDKDKIVNVASTIGGGYQINIEGCGYAYVVLNDHRDYQRFMSYWKEAKKNAISDR